MKKGRLSKTEKEYIETVVESKRPIDIANDLDRNLDVVLKYILTTGKSFVENQTAQIPTYYGGNKKHNLRGGGENKFVDDGTLATEDREIDKILWKGKQPKKRHGVNRNPLVRASCKKCSKVEMVPKNLVDAQSRYLCIDCTNNPQRR